jgi:hypothetical protein
MKKFLLTISILFAATLLFAQKNPKKKEEEKPPTQKELQDMMKEMQAGMPEMSAEDKKPWTAWVLKCPILVRCKKTLATSAMHRLKKPMKMITGLCHRKMLQE